MGANTEGCLGLDTKACPGTDTETSNMSYAGAVGTEDTGKAADCAMTAVVN